MPVISSRVRALTQIDCLVLLIVVGCLTSVVLAATTRSQEVANRIECARNLKQIGNGLMLYSNENRGSFPRAVSDFSGKVSFFTVPGGEKGKEADPFGKDAKPELNDLTAAMFLLIRTQDLTSEVFTCPSTEDKIDDYAGEKAAVNRMNFTSPFNLSYSLINVYPTREAIANGFKTFITAFSAEFAVAADLNPGDESLLKLSADSPAADIAKGNSRNHGGDGQNVLYADGHVDFQTTPLAGVKGDNIYTYGKGAGIIGSAADAEDSILLPTAKERPANVDPAKIPGLTREEIKAARTRRPSTR